MLHGAGNADGKVNIRFDSLAGLADLHGVGHPTGIYRGAARANGTAEHVGEVLEYAELLFALESATAGNNDLRAFQRWTLAFNYHSLFHVNFAQISASCRGHFFQSESLWIFFGFKRLRPDD